MVKPLRTLRNLPRLKDISLILARHGLGDLASRLGSGVRVRLFGGRARPESSFPRSLRLALQDLGPLYIKLGQLIASRPDIFPHHLVREMERLRDDVDPIPFDQIKVVLEESLGRKISECFRQIDEQPVASASIAQVYRGMTLDGHRVAIKIRKPGIEKLISRDLGLLDQFAEALARQPESGGFDPHGVVRELRHALDNEINFNFERNSIDRIRLAFSGDEEMLIPNTYGSVSSREVLVMDWIDGVPLGRAELKEDQRREVVRSCARSLFTMIFRHGQFHGDPHPSNIILQPDGRLCWIDFGLTGLLTKELRWRLSKMLKALVERDYEELSQQVLHVGYCHGDADSFALTQSIANRLDPYVGLKISDVDLPALLKSIIDIATEHRIEIAPGFVRMTRSLVLLEGLTEKLDPGFDTASELEPLLIELMREQVSAESVIRRAADQTIDGIETLGELPDLVSDALRKATRGRLRVESEIVGLDRLSKRIDLSSRRLVEGILTSALLICSVILFVSSMPWWAFLCAAMALFLLARLLLGYFSPWQSR
ncbi:MAG: AarF/UbiB family protein [Planctomycetota bacterium]|nr:AarF/UbiB family protein [Planctomycetota bacterium]